MKGRKLKKKNDWRERRHLKGHKGNWVSEDGS